MGAELGHCVCQNCSTNILSNMNYVYVITCLINKKQYIGQTKDPENRRKEHFFISQSRPPKRRQVIHEAIGKYGIENFTFEVVSEHLTEIEAYEEEHRLILQKRAEGIKLYNMNDGGIGGVNPGQETRKKMSESRILFLKKNLEKTGSKVLDETRRKISEAAKKQFENQDARDAISTSVKNRWKSWSEEKRASHIERLRIANLNREHKSPSEEARKKIADTLRKRADEKGRAKENIIELIHNCPDCGREVKRKGIAGWKSQLKSGRCKPCSVKIGHKTRKLKKQQPDTITSFPCDSSDP